MVVGLHMEAELQSSPWQMQTLASLSPKLPDRQPSSRSSQGEQSRIALPRRKRNFDKICHFLSQFLTLVVIMSNHNIVTQVWAWYKLLCFITLTMVYGRNMAVVAFITSSTAGCRLPIVTLGTITLFWSSPFVLWLHMLIIDTRQVTPIHLLFVELSCH